MTTSSVGWTASPIELRVNCSCVSSPKNRRSTRLEWNTSHPSTSRQGLASSSNGNDEARVHRGHRSAPVAFAVVTTN